MIATACVLLVVGTSAFVHSMFRLRAALWALGGGTCALFAAALLVLGGAGSPNLSFLIETETPYVPVLSVVIVTLALVAALTGATVERIRPHSSSRGARRTTAEPATSR